MVSWWVGGYGADMNGSAEGVGLLHSRDDGSLEYAGVVAEAPSPSFLLRDGDHLHAALEGTGEVATFAVPGFERLSTASSGGGLPCQLATIGDSLIVANYADGTVGVIRAGELTQVIAGGGSGPRAEQDGPHAHAAFAVDAVTLLSLDLGADRVHTYAVDGGVLERTFSLALPPGTGPRDIVRHPSGLILVLGELGGELMVFDWVDESLELCSFLALPGALEADHAAGIAIDGDFVYVGLRGSDRISVMRTSRGGRRLEAVGWVSSEGQFPRHLAARDGLLHVANQNSSTVASFRLGEDGIPRLIAAPSAVPSPTHLLAIG